MYNYVVLLPLLSRERVWLHEQDQVVRRMADVNAAKTVEVLWTHLNKQY